MAIQYKNGITSLVEDLQRLGYTLESVSTLKGSPGRTADIQLSNDVIVSWDRSSKRVWTTGPYPAARRLETSLRFYHQGPSPIRLFLRIFGKDWTGFLKPSRKRALPMLTPQKAD